MATITNYLTAVKEYLQECIDTGDYTHYRDEGDNWILMCFQNQVRDYAEHCSEWDSSPILACVLWTGFCNAYCNKFETESERSVGIDIAGRVDYYFDYCVDRKKRKETSNSSSESADEDDEDCEDDDDDENYTYKVNDFTDLIYSISSTEDEFCEIVNAIKTVKITPADKKRAEEVGEFINSEDIVKFDDICNADTLKRINEFYKDYVNEHSYYCCICDEITDYLDDNQEEFSCRRSDFDGYDSDSPYFESRLSYCDDY